jgi:hypothetical protein
MTETMATAHVNARARHDIEHKLARELSAEELEHRETLESMSARQVEFFVELYKTSSSVACRYLCIVFQCGGIEVTPHYNALCKSTGLW